MGACQPIKGVDMAARRSWSAGWLCAPDARRGAGSGSRPSHPIRSCYVLLAVGRAQKSWGFGPVSKG